MNNTSRPNPTDTYRFFRVEYDLNYRGGEYTGVGDFVYLPFAGLQDDSPEEVSRLFSEITGYDDVHIVNFNLDDRYTEYGDSLY